ncbi:hypothetical protein F5883DRAFT_620343 [Diaporthe sp. PMI_573]|nr:hypothetical protein F5883DRAFT_620343 [Diaporthaceae sp. PMI_573]
MLADVQQLDDRSQRMQIKGNSWVMKSHMNYRDVPRVTRATRASTYPYYQHPNRNIDPELKSALNQRLQAGAHPTTQALVPLGLRYVKILGAGSQGVAVLFEVDNGDGTTRQVVAKYDTGEENDPDNLRATQDGEGLSNEKTLMRLWLAGLKPERGDRVPIREELVPTYHDGNLVQPQGNAIVNMDMNYNNIMIGDYDTDPGVHPHDQVPIFKVGDLGIAFSFPENAPDLFSRIVFTRICGNSGTKAPLDDMDGGQICIKLESPPVGSTVGITGLMDQDFSVYTYSGHLLKNYFNHYDMNLRMTIAWCMAHVPGQRPTMTQLQDVLMRAERQVFNEEGRTSIAELLGSPPPGPNTTSNHSNEEWRGTTGAKQSGPKGEGSLQGPSIKYAKNEHSSE